MSGVRRLASARPMSSGSGTEWLPTFGVLWQVVQVPAIAGTSQVVVQALDVADHDRLGVEQRLAARDRAARDRDAAIAPLRIGDAAVLEYDCQPSYSVIAVGVKPALAAVVADQRVVDAEVGDDCAR